MSGWHQAPLTFLRVTRYSVWSRLLLMALFACRDRQVSEKTRPSPTETAIARDLTARFGTPATVTCTLAAAIPVRCDATLADGTKLPIAIENVGEKAEWGWRVDGLVIETKQIVELVQAELATLRVQQTATCGMPIVVIAPGDRIACTLSGGGAAFVRIESDGTSSLELALDAASAAARTELVTPDRDRQLIEQSKALEVLEWESDGEEAIPTDGGVADAMLANP